MTTGCNPLRDAAEPDTTVSMVSSILAYLQDQAENAANLSLTDPGGAARLSLTPPGAAGQAVLLGLLRQTLDQAVTDMTEHR